MWESAAIAVMVTAISWWNFLLANEFECDALGAVFISSIPWLSRYSLNAGVFYSRAPSVYSLCAFLSKSRYVFAMDLIIALYAVALVGIS